MTEQEKARKAAELLVAWADGKKIQILLEQGWIDYTFHHQPAVSIIDLKKFRLKPEPIKQWYRVALFKYDDDFLTQVADNGADENDYEGNINFVKWLTDRIEYEVPSE